VGVASVPLNLTALLPCVVPKFAPAIVTTVPTGPDVGVRLVRLGVTGEPAPAALKAATAAPQMFTPPRVASAATAPAAGCTRSSTSSFAPGAAGTCASFTKPLPAVNVAPSAVATTPSTRSPWAVVVTTPLVGAAVVPCAAVAPSNAAVAATPVYSTIAKRRVVAVGVVIV